MNSREKFLANMSFQPGADSLKWEFGYWAGTLRRWYQEGLDHEFELPVSLGHGESVRGEGMGQKPGGYIEKDIHKLFGMEEGFLRVPINNFLSPEYTEELLEDHGDWVLKKDKWGITVRESKSKDTPNSFIEGPVQSRADWEKIKERLQPDLTQRLPGNWNDIVQSYKNRESPLILGGSQGFYGSPRYLLGDEKILTTFYDDPDLILDINNHLCNLWIDLYDQILQQTSVDLGLIWEDMSYKNGPLISPAMFRKFLLPFYKRLTSLFRDHNVKIIWVDTDGNFWKIIPLFLEGGVTGFYPFEAAANMNVAEVREAFPKLQMMGGIDKMKLAKGRQEIDLELEQKVKPILGKGGFIPSVDHLIPSDISWECFVYYRRKLNEMIDRIG